MDVADVPTRSRLNPSPVAEPAVTRRLVQSSPRYGALSHKEASDSIGIKPRKLCG